MQSRTFLDPFSPAQSIVTAALVPDTHRLEFLPRHFARYMLLVEQTIFTQMRTLCPTYEGGFFDFYDLSNGGCFLALAQSEPIRVRVPGNGYSGVLSAEASGVIATLFSLSHLSFQHRGVERFAERFYQLREFAMTHREASAIFDAID